MMDERGADEAPAAAPARAGMSRHLGRVGLEVFSIVLGVLLALAVSEWQEDRNNRERVGAALGHVRSELQDNLALLEAIHPGNLAVVEGIRGDTAGDDSLQFIPGVQIADSAWRTLGTTGLTSYVDYELLLELSRLYAIVDVYRRTGYSFLDANMTLAATATAMQQGAPDNEAFSRNFLSAFELLTQVEEALMELHRKGLADLEAAVAKR